MAARLERLVAAGGAALVASGCSLANRVDACENEPSEVRVNQRGDLSEFTSHSRAAARLLDNNRIAVAFVAQATGAASSEVRVALVDATTGERTIVCQSDFEYTLSEPGVLAYAASVAPVELTISGQTAKAAVSWIEGAQDTRVKIVFIDAKGCPLGKPFSPLSDPAIATSGVTLAWSPTMGQLLAVYHDYQRVLATWMADSTPPPPAVLATPHRVDQMLAVAIADDGRGAISWASYPNGSALLEGRVEVSVALVGADGSLRPGTTGAAEPFVVSFPASNTGANSVDLCLAAAPDRYALSASLADSSFARQVVYLTELSAADGATVTAPRRTEPETGAAHFFSSLAYSPDGSPIVAWMSAQHGGTVARVFGAGAKPRFNAVSCDEKPFPVGARAKEGMQGQPSVLVSGGRVWVFHPGQPAYDSTAMGVVGWHMPWSELWPAKD